MIDTMNVRIYLSRRANFTYRVDVVRDGHTSGTYYIKGYGFAIDTLTKFIGHHRYTIEYGDNSLYNPIYSLHERTW
jgi:hypothetical protein